MSKNKKPKSDQKLEHTISIAGTDVSVYSKPMTEKDGCWGYYCPEPSHYIVLEPNAENEHLWVNYLHEVFHAISDLYELNLTDEQEERCANLVSKGYYQALGGSLPKAPIKRRKQCKPKAENV